MKNWITSRNVPEKFAKILRTYLPATTHATKAVDEWLGSGERTLVLAGGVGTGKTFAAAALVFETSHARFLTSTEITRLSRFDDDLSILERCPLLVLDDLGEEYADEKGHSSSMIGALVAARYANDGRTVITTNLAKANFRQRYGDRLWDRFRESGRWVNLGGASMRTDVMRLRKRAEVEEREEREAEAERWFEENGGVDRLLEEKPSELSKEFAEMLERVAQSKKLRVVEVDEDARRKDLQEQARELAEKAAEK